MISLQESASYRRLQIFTLAFGVSGFIAYFATRGFRFALAFLLGALGSYGNLLLYTWLARAISPGERPQKPWTAGLFILRYFGLWLVGYTTVKALDVSPLPVLFGLLATTAAVLASSVIDLIRSVTGSKTPQ